MSGATTPTAKRGLTLERSFDTSVAHLFDCFTQPELLTGWWGPQGTFCPSAEVDFRTGGSYRFVMQGIESGEVNVVHGKYLEISPPKRLVFTWAWEDNPEEVTEVTLQFSAEGATRSTLLLRHKRFPNVERTTRHSEGWDSSLVSLAQLLTKKSNA